MGNSLTKFKVYKLKEIQDYIKNQLSLDCSPKVNNPDGFTWETYNIHPLYTNYIIDCTDPSNKVVHEVNRKFRKSKVPFTDHIALLGVTDSCYIKIRAEDAEKLFRNSLESTV